jgi:hypothetical protein
MDPNVTLVLQMMNEKLNNLDQKIDKTTSRLDTLTEILKDTNLNIQVLQRYIEETSEHPQSQSQSQSQYKFQPQSQYKSQPQSISNMSFPDEIEQEQKQEPGPQGDNWTGGFGGLSNFNPLKEVVSSTQTFDYTPRPIKNKDPVDGDTDIIYMYEKEGGIEIDNDDLEETLDKIEKEGDKHAFRKSLVNITNGIKTIYSSRDPELYHESISIMGRSIELRYNKLTSSSNNTSYNKLFG